MSAREASREFKAVVRAEGPLDLDTLSHAVEELKGALDVPGNAKLEINTSLRDGGRWAIVAKWDPKDDKRPQAMVHVQPGGVQVFGHPFPTPEQVAHNLQQTLGRDTASRRIRDNPQA